MKKIDLNKTPHTVKINRDGPSPEARKKLAARLAPIILRLERENKDHFAKPNK